MMDDLIGSQYQIDGQHLPNPIIPRLGTGDEARKLHDVAHVGKTLVLVGLENLRPSIVGWLRRRVGSESTVQ